MNKKNFGETYPDIAEQWHPSKNEGLSPYDVTPMSGKKVWWKCPKGDDHEWKSVIANRAKGSGCPICANQKAVKSNSLGTINPKLASEWHPAKNGNLTPFDVLPSANKMIWWKCPKGDDHEWKAKLNNRANGKGCPICSGHKVVASNSLLTLFPDVAKQWHPTKNGDLTPDIFPAGTSKKVWWKCPKGDDHEWRATILHRTRGTGCPKCNPAYSIPELRIFCELKSIFDDVHHRAIVSNSEVDIFIPAIKFGIEFDGVYWHEDKHEKDLAKNQLLSEEITLLRVREEGLPLLSNLDLQVEKRSLDISVIKEILKTILSCEQRISQKIENRITDYLQSDQWRADELFNELYTKRKHVAFEKSLSFIFPEIARDWHPTKNDSLLPEYFTPGSGRVVWWRGKCRHIWQDSINHRTSGRACPKCRYKRASQTRQRKKEDKANPQLKLNLK